MHKARQPSKDLLGCKDNRLHSTSTLPETPTLDPQLLQPTPSCPLHRGAGLEAWPNLRRASTWPKEGRGYQSTARNITRIEEFNRVWLATESSTSFHGTKSCLPGARTRLIAVSSASCYQRDRKLCAGSISVTQPKRPVLDPRVLQCSRCSHPLLRVDLQTAARHSTVTHCYTYTLCHQSTACCSE